MTNSTRGSPTLPPSSDLKRELAGLLRERQKRSAQSQLASYSPYQKQREFHAAGREHRERLLMAGNQLGKTFAGAAELAMHLTGAYPDWWEGRRWARPTRWWAASKTSEVTRDGVQRLLLGEPKDKGRRGEGMIPGRALLSAPSRASVAGAIDSCLVRHASGGTSSLGFKSYNQGREKWQGETLDGVWYDEEPPLDIYLEGLTRTNATGGCVFMTFTPLLGMSDVVSMFLGEGAQGR